MKNNAVVSLSIDDLLAIDNAIKSDLVSLVCVKSKLVVLQWSVSVQTHTEKAGNIPFPVLQSLVCFLCCNTQRERKKQTLKFICAEL